MIYSPACGNLREENKIIGHIEHIGAQRRCCSPSRHFALRMQNGSVVCNKVVTLGKETRWHLLNLLKNELDIMSQNGMIKINYLTKTIKRHYD